MSLPQIAPVGGLTVSQPKIELKTTLTVVNYNGAITMPAGIVSGDIIVVMQALFDQTGGATPNVTYAAGSGFINLSNGSSTVTNTGPEGSVTSKQTLAVGISYKLADGSESGATIGGFGNGADRDDAIVFVFSGKPGATIVKHASTNGVTDSTASAVWHINLHAAGAKTNGGTVTGVDQVLSSAYLVYAGYAILAPGGAVTEVTASGTAPKVSRSGYLEIM